MGSYTHNFINEPRTNNALVRVRAKDDLGLYSPYDTSDAVFVINRPPNAPSLAAPSGTRTEDEILFDWTHNDPDADPQTEFALRFTSPTWDASSGAYWAPVEAGLADGAYYGIAWGGDRFIAMPGTNAPVLISTDGRTWTEGGSPLLTPYNMTYSPALGKFCIVGSYGDDLRCSLSTDGTTWTRYAIQTADNKTWTDVIWAPEIGKFCAISYGLSATSSDGQTWTATGVFPSNYYGIAWSGALGLFVIVSEGTATAGSILTSPDGLTWTERTYPGTVAGRWRDIVWSPELGIFCAVGSEQTTNQIMTSPDGITWTLRNAPAGAFWRAIEWSPEWGLFVAVSSDSNGYIATSPDGVTWTLRNNPVRWWTNIQWSSPLKRFVVVSDVARVDRFAISEVQRWWNTANAQRYRDLIMSSSPASYWRLGDPQGSTSAADETAGGRTATHASDGISFGRESLLPYDRNTAATFFGAHTGLDVASGPPIPNGFTVEAWVQLDVEDTADRQTVVSYGENESTGFVFAAKHAGGVDIPARLWVNHAGTWPGINSTTILRVGQIYHLAATYDAATKEAIFFVNGVEEARAALSTSAYSPPTGNLTIGARDSRTVHRLAGGIDEVVIWDTVLTPATIARHYTIGANSGWSDSAVWNASSVQQVTVHKENFQPYAEYHWTAATGD